MSACVLVTGGAGFIGSHLTEAILASGARVIVLDDLSTGRLRNLERVEKHPGLHLVHGSARDEVLVDELVHQAGAVVHLAAAVGVELVLSQPLRSFTNNVDAAQVVIQAAHRHQRRILVVSSSEVYGKNEAVPLTEEAEAALGSTTARWVYGISKLVAEVLANAYHHDDGLAATVVRLFNTVGPRQSPAYGMVIPRLVRQAVSGQALTVYGTGRQTRCFCHVADAVEGLLGLLDHPGSVGHMVNLGAHEEISMLELARRIIELAGSESRIELVPYERAYPRGFEDVARRAPDTSRISALTGWRPIRTLDQILRETIAEAAVEHQAGLVARRG